MRSEKCERLGGAAESEAQRGWRPVYTVLGPEDRLPHAPLSLTYRLALLSRDFISATVGNLFL